MREAGIEVGAGLVSRAWMNVRNDWPTLDLRQRIARFATPADMTGLWLPLPVDHRPSRVILSSSRFDHSCTSFQC
jgi:hypothetical protein